MFLVRDFSGFVGEDATMTICGCKSGCLRDSRDLMKVGRIVAVLCDDLRRLRDLGGGVSMYKTQSEQIAFPLITPQICFLQRNPNIIDEQLI
ncbi:hypothetical protein VIGAN_02295900 [Vigna angularis var. angularis]|uniref:Uncharacterized protein n=1 Tax=Vigna angularis var. angularis TaxID=157739 RepID=A0A0S3RH94_PHAAN|nr:hypothetical protein VIGAN_02295900 [Vigna angularis var. angularis]